MRKLRLDLHALRVESFGTAEGRPWTRGTVRGAGITTARCETRQSGCLYDSCGGTCVISCAPTCPVAGCDS
jgi:hypothetical protein